MEFIIMAGMGRPSKYKQAKNTLNKNQFNIQKKAIELYEEVFDIIVKAAFDEDTPIGTRVSAAKEIKKIADDYLTPEEIEAKNNKDRPVEKKESTGKRSSLIATTWDGDTSNEVNIKEEMKRSLN